MALSTKMEMRQGQQLVMTPQLQQAIRLLQLSNLELNRFVDEEMERNPLLERDDADGEPATRTIDTPDSADGRIGDGGGGDGGDADWGGVEGAGLDLSRPTGEVTAVLDTAIENICPDASPSEMAQEASDAGLSSNLYANARQNGSSFDDDAMNLEAFVAADLTLREHLTAQLSLATNRPVDLFIGRQLIDQIDDAGYLSVDLAAMALRLGTSLDEVERVLGIVHTFDPAGVGARSLSECLALQLKEQNRYDPMIAALLERLDLVASHNLAALKKHIGCDFDELSEMIIEIKRLNPKPGLQFGSAPVSPVVQDVAVRLGADGAWLIELNQDTLPRVLVNRTYFSRVSKVANGAQDKTYLADCLQNANWLVKSLDQRARTILKVSEEIVRQQDAFLMHGVEYLRPLNLRTVADAISMHESTVSRVTSNKYIATPRGIFELKYFFTSSIASASSDGEAHSSEAVRHRIKQMIDAEPAHAVLSDDKIVEKLKADGIDIARRTVAKYREALRIPSSVQRRREKTMSERLAKAD